MASVITKQRVILVDGYLREYEKKLNLSSIIPKSINSIIFEFQTLTAKWNKKWSSSKVKLIDDGTIAIIENNFDDHTIYGDQIVKYAQNFVWNLEIIKGTIMDIAIGISPNKEEILRAHRHDYGFWLKGGYIWEVFSGRVAFNGHTRKIADRKRDVTEADKFNVIFNWKESIFRFIFNGTDLGNVFDITDLDQISKDSEFRFAVNVAFDNIDIYGYEPKQWIAGIKIDSTDY